MIDVGIKELIKNQDNFYGQRKCGSVDVARNEWIIVGQKKIKQDRFKKMIVYVQKICN